MEMGQDVFRFVGPRAENHIVKGFLRKYDADAKMEYTNWKEIDLYDFVKSAADGKSFNTRIDDSKFTFIDPTEKSYSLALQKQEAKERISIGDFNSEIMKTIFQFYINCKDAAEPNDLYLNIENDRAFGFYTLNVHCADIDVKMGPDANKNHLMIRYNENMHQGWKPRLEYISTIFQNMGYDTNIKGGFIHMNHPNLGDDKNMTPILTETLRGLVSTTHLNLTFGYAPECLDEAIELFQSGTTNIYDHLESLPHVMAKKAAAKTLVKGFYREY